ncbi:MAG: 30S ribosomal protein S20 [Gammaproteobacteria bacterium]|nr:30S ribosomal protein S20 [Gammaproteobacteria bacterium]
MANTAQARKRIRQAEKNRLQNTSMRSAMRTACKKVVKALAGGEKAQAETAYKAAVPELDRMARKGIIHKNKAARQKSRMNRQLKAMQS